MKKWVRFQTSDGELFGCLDGEKITQYEGSMFGESQATTQVHALEEVTLLAPCVPAKMIALWNNFYALAQKQGHEIPEMPYYFLKPSSCIVGPQADIIPPSSYEGRIFYEGELGIVIGQLCKDVEEADALSYVKGYTCVNDVTALQLIAEKEAYAQWTRAKSFDTFGVVGPCIAEIDDPNALVVKTLVNGRERQNYPVSDMIFSPSALVSLLSKDMTLEPGDIIACGTSLGAMPMKANIELHVSIDGIGVLENTFNPN